MASAQHPSHDSSQPTQQGFELGAWEWALADAVADRVVYLLLSRPRSVDLVDAATVATALSVSRDWVYAHAAELGGRRIGQGSRGRLRFDLGYVLDTWQASKLTSPRAAIQHPRKPRTQRAKSTTAMSDSELLPIRRPRGRRKRTEGDERPHAALY
jgi:hypothetical protein